ncbi:MAG: hypothetical protein ACI9IA_001420 [Enterobacterales bacterium]|jgi:hypothetical protein
MKGKQQNSQLKNVLKIIVFASACVGSIANAKEIKHEVASTSSVIARGVNPIYKDELKEFVETFRLSIINQDAETYKSLFYSKSPPWIVVFSDEMVKLRRSEKPNFPRSVDFSKMGSPFDREMKEREEKIWNIKIETDGYLGYVHFNYSDHEKGLKKAWGTQAWVLVREDAGWKIVSMTYVVTENLVPKKIQ